MASEPRTHIELPGTNWSYCGKARERFIAPEEATCKICCQSYRTGDRDRRLKAESYDRGFQAGVAACREKIEGTIARIEAVPGYSRAAVAALDSLLSAIDTDKEKEADRG
jgi:hypothetical protein